MNVPLRAPALAPRRAWPSLLVQLAIVLVVAAVAAATFVLSYDGVHAIALQSGVPTELARLYPAIFDAVLVIACLAVPALRDGHWGTRVYTWLVIFLIVAILGATDAVHAMNVALPRRDMAGVVAVLPWALLLLAFSLWLAVLRHFRAQQARLAASAPVEYAEIAPAEAIAASELSAPAEAAESTGEVAANAPAAQPGTSGSEQADDSGELDSEQPDSEQSAGTAEQAGAPAEEAASADESAGVPAPTRQDLPVLAALPAAVAEPAKEPRSANSVSLDVLLNGPSADTGEPAADDVEVPSVTYATGPRLRRVRSLPAPPVEDE